MTRVSIGLDLKSVSKAIEELKEYSKRVEEGTETAIFNLVDESVDIAQGIYGNAVNVVGDIVNDTYLIRAMGTPVCFFEFGAGYGSDPYVNYPLQHMNPKSIPPYGYGTWSISHARELITNGYWTFGGRQMTQVPQRRAMFYASQNIRNNYTKEIIKEIKK